MRENTCFSPQGISVIDVNFMLFLNCQDVTNHLSKPADLVSTKTYQATFHLPSKDHYIKGSSKGYFKEMVNEAAASR